MLVLREGMALAVSGMALGVVAALGLMRLLASLIYCVRPTDPATLVAASLALGSIAFSGKLRPRAPRHPGGDDDRSEIRVGNPTRR